MNWLHFFYWVTGLYALYYLVVILADLARGKASPTLKTNPAELTFSETVQPVALQHQASAEPAAASGRTGRNENAALQQVTPEIISSGGVSLKDLFVLARQEAILYTYPVSY